jgi:hypothetical protein
MTGQLAKRRKKEMGNDLIKLKKKEFK